MKLPNILLAGGAAVLFAVACTTDTVMDPGKSADPLEIRPLALTAVVAQTSFSAGDSVAVDLSWIEPAGDPVDGYTVVREFQDDGKDTLQGFKGVPDTIGSFTVDTVYQSGDTLYDSTWSINVRIDGSGVPLSYTDELAPVFGLIDSIVVYIDPLTASKERKRMVVLEDGKEYRLSYYVNAWILLDQNFEGGYGQWLQLPLYETYGYYGRYSEPAVFSVSVNGLTVNVTN